MRADKQTNGRRTMTSTRSSRRKEALDRLWTLDFGLWTLAFRRLSRPGLPMHRHIQRPKPAAKSLKMLFRQHLCRGHQRHVESTFNGHQRTASGYNRFARPHVPLDQPPHRRSARQILPQLAQYSSLRAGEVKAKLVKKWLDQTIIALARQPARLGIEVLAPPLQGQL